MHRRPTALAALSIPLLLAGGCASTDAPSPAAAPVSAADARVAAIEAAHGGHLYNAKPAVFADMAVEFGPMLLMGDMTFTPSLGRVNMNLKEAGTILYDNGESWIWPADAAVPGPPPRFHVLTWPYFVAAPFKLDDPGATASDAGVLAVTGPSDKRPGTKIGFDAGVGDAPDDWYIAFTDKKGRMDALGYIVTYGKPKAEAEKKPSMILYSDFVNVDGVEFATTWDFYFWDPAKGVGDRKGTAKLANIRFVQPTAATFAKNPSAVEVGTP